MYIKHRRELMKNADVNGDPKIFIVSDSMMSPERIKRGGTLTIYGHNIMIDGKHGTCGVFLRAVSGNGSVPLFTGGDPREVNTPDKVVVDVPADLPLGGWKLEIRTQFAGPGRPLHDIPIVIVYDVTMRTRAE